MTITKKTVISMLKGAAQLLQENSDYLSEIDSKFGDGDHGVTIHKIAVLIQQEIQLWQEESIHDFIESLGEKIMGVNGGSAGPLYGTMIGGLAVALTNETEITPPILKEMFQSMLEEMQDITTAKIGDKTMMDALIPAVQAAQKAPDNIGAILESAAKAAKEGAKKSEEFVSRFGRAKSYKQQTIGTPDAGAVSTSVFFEGLAKGFAVL